MDAIDQLRRLMKADDKKKFPKPPADKDADGIPDNGPSKEDQAGGDAQAQDMADAYNGAKDNDDATTESGESGNEDGSESDDGQDQGGDEGDDSGDENPFAADDADGEEDGDGDMGGAGDEDSDEDGTPNDMDEDADGDGMQDDTEVGAVAAQGGAGSDLASTVQQLAAAEKDFYAAKGQHGAGHHKAEGAMDTFHKLVRKLVRTIAGQHGIDPSGKTQPGEEGDEGGKPNPFAAGGKEKAEGDEGGGKPNPFAAKDKSKGKPAKGANPFQTKGKGDGESDAGVDEEASQSSEDEGDSSKPKKKSPFDKETMKALSALGPAAQEELRKAFGLESWPDPQTQAFDAVEASGDVSAANYVGDPMGGAFIDWGKMSAAKEDGEPGDSSGPATPTGPTMPQPNPMPTPPTTGNPLKGKVGTGPFPERGKMNGKIVGPDREQIVGPDRTKAMSAPIGKGPFPDLKASSGLDALDVLGQLAKGGGGFKYISKKANGRGGWDYTYKHSGTGESHTIATRMNPDKTATAVNQYTEAKHDARRGLNGETHISVRSNEDGDPISADEHSMGEHAVRKIFKEGPPTKKELQDAAHQASKDAEAAETTASNVEEQPASVLAHHEAAQLHSLAGNKEHAAAHKAASESQRHAWLDRRTAHYAAKKSDPIDALELLVKGPFYGSHKYISRKRNAHGGYDYTYKHPGTGQTHHIETHSSEDSAAARHVGGQPHETAIARKQGNVVVSSAHSGMADPPLQTMLEHAAADTHRLRVEKKPKASAAPKIEGHHEEGGQHYVDSNFVNRAQHALPGFYLEHMGFGEFFMEGPKGERIDFNRMAGKDFPGQSGRSHLLQDNQGGALVKQLLDAMGSTKKSGDLLSLLEPLIKDDNNLSLQTRVTGRTASGDPVQSTRGLSGGGQGVGQSSTSSGSSTNRAAVAEGVTGSRTTHRGFMSGKMKKKKKMIGKVGKGPFPDLSRSEGTDASGRGLRKSWYEFGRESKNPLPDEYLYDYLLAAIEEAYEHEKRESAHTNVEAKDQALYFGQCVMREIVSAMRQNLDLRRACKKYNVTAVTVAALLVEKGLLKPKSDTMAVGSGDGNSAMGGTGLAGEVMAYSQNSPWVQKDAFAAQGVPVANAAPDNVAKSIVNDRLDPADALATTRAKQMSDLWNGADAAARVNYSASCPIHSRDISKAQAASNPMTPCTCSN